MEKIFITNPLFVFLVSDNTYPFPVSQLRVKEEFHTITVYWENTHQWYDPIEYIVSCNSNGNYLINVERNTTCVCEQMTLSDTTAISVLTRVAIPNYEFDRIGIANIDGRK